MSLWLYLEINILCILVTSLILARLSSNIDKKTDNVLFMRVLVSCILLFTLDAIWALIDNDVLQLSVTGNSITNCLYMCMTGVVGYTWYSFAEVSINSEFINNKVRNIFAIIPLFILVALSISSIWTGAIFRIDDNNVYHRGSLYIVQVIIGYGYVGLPTLKSLYLYLREENYILKGVYANLTSFSIFPLMAGIIQILVPSLPALCSGLVLAILTVFITIQNRQISRDELTGLNNRNQLNKFLTEKLSDSYYHPFYLLMLDMDYFKKINDTYGHIVGDKALVEMADVLRFTCGPKNCFIARFGGDEFTVICETEDTTFVEEIKKEIKSNLANYQEKSKVPYLLSVSIGSTYSGDGKLTLQSIISRADEDLYKAKQNR